MKPPTLRIRKVLADNCQSRFYLSLLLAALLCVASCAKDSEPAARLHVLGGLTMGTTYSVKIYAAKLEPSKEEIEQAIRVILDNINASMSTYIGDSELSLLNQAKAGSWISLSDDLFQISEEAIAISRLTRGHFDISVGALVNLWGFGPEKSEVVPSGHEIDQALANSGLELIELRESSPALKKLKQQVYLDLSGIAKGFAVDKIAEYLDMLHIDNFLVEIGGEIRASGVNEVGFAWRIGIEQPDHENRTVRRIIKLDNISMATSGDYRNYFEKNGRRYSHTIDPVSGYPINHKLASVTVLHEKASTADALATGFLVMGKEPATTIANDKGLAVFFIEKSASGFEESYTPEFKNFLLKK